MKESMERTAYLIGEDGVTRLGSKHVALFGVGGVGGYVAEALGRAGIGTLTLVDKDTVSVSNINRQIIATYDTVGRSKTEVMAERLRSINPEIKLECRDCFFLPDTADTFDFAKYDYVVDAVDTVTAKLELVKRAQEAGVPILSCMGTGNKLDPSRFEIADIGKTSVCPLAKVMRRELKKRGITKLKVLYSKEEPIKHEAGTVPGSISFVPSVAGLMIAGEVIKDLLREEKTDD
ncbi:MAG: tRNA threonylcarbamoyladenosine dehydratase [Lachnospiraceae bacterium]|nr:tRNA threonylcarbamoyladenosine dehydratase [Lachnospiraceae bacterium]